jgi:hypothetical protein
MAVEEELTSEKLVPALNAVQRWEKAKEEQMRLVLELTW